MRVRPGPGVPHGFVVPARDLVESFSHASGPGGQGVNTSDSRVQLSVDLATAGGITDDQRRRLLAGLAARLVGSVITVTVAENRSQLRNRAIARERLAEILREALTPTISRRATRPTRGSTRRRLAAKSARSEIKQQRRRPGPE